MTLSKRKWQKCLSRIIKRASIEALTVVKHNLSDAKSFEQEATEFMDGSYRLARGSDWNADLVIEEGDSE